MNAVRIIGLGSAHGADSAGWDAVRALRDSGFARQRGDLDLSLHTCAVPAQLWQLLEDCRLAILVDAVAAQPGTLNWYESDDLDSGGARHSVHGFGVGEALALVRALQPGSPRIRVLGIGVGAAGEPGPDPQVLGACIEAELDACLAGSGRDHQIKQDSGVR